MGFTVLLDANVLYPVYTRDLLLHLAESGLYEVRWTDQILQEVSRNLKAKRDPELHGRIDRMIANLKGGFDDALITDYEDLIPSMRNHPKDAHVLAAAVKEGVDVIVTDNVVDFPPESYRKYNIDVLTVDKFLICQFSLCRPEVFCSLCEELLGEYRNPPVSLADFLAGGWLRTSPRFSEMVLSYLVES